MTDKKQDPCGSDSSAELSEAFEAWWKAQDTGLGQAFKFACWNAWLAASVRAADITRNLETPEWTPDLERAAHAILGT
jgi:hypothetical protein